uniref:Ovule protein n=1 Tax=Caenorhabditis tropicalis TaxID=1561998 RepID=A0A1I7T2H7_9PELO
MPEFQYTSSSVSRTFIFKLLLVSGGQNAHQVPRGPNKSPIYEHDNRKLLYGQGGCTVQQQTIRSIELVSLLPAMTAATKKLNLKQRPFILSQYCGKKNK